MFLGKLLSRRRGGTREVYVNGVLNFSSSVGCMSVGVEGGRSGDGGVGVSGLERIDSLSDTLGMSGRVLIRKTVKSNGSILVTGRMLDVVRGCGARSASCVPIVLRFSSFPASAVRGVEGRMRREVGLTGGSVSLPGVVICLSKLSRFGVGLSRERKFVGRLCGLVADFRSVGFVMAAEDVRSCSFRVFLSSCFSECVLYPLRRGRVVSVMGSFCGSSGGMKSRVTRSDLFGVLPGAPVATVLLKRVLGDSPGRVPSALARLCDGFVRVILSE